MFDAKLTILGKQVEVPVKLVTEYKKLFPPNNDEDFLSEIEDAGRYEFEVHPERTDSELNSIVLEIFESAITNAKAGLDAAESEEFIGSLIEELKAEGDI